MVQIKLLIADWCLGLALFFGGQHWSNDTLLRYQDLINSIRRDLDDHKASA